MEKTAKKKKLITDIFVDGAKNGWNMGINSIIPNLIMAFVVIKALNVSGLLSFLGTIFAPVMGIFGLPGEAIAVLLGAWMSMGGGVGVAVSLFNEGKLSGQHIAILIPAIYLMGAQLQYMGRILGTAEVDARKYPVLFLISIVNALLAMLVMNFIV